MKIENEYMTIEFDEKGNTLIVTNKNTNEWYELDVLNGYFWVKDSNSNVKVYVEWSDKQ